MAKNPGVKLLADIQSQYPEVRKVVDAKTSRKIEFAIDSRDCELGTPESPRTCPASIAVSRHTGFIAMVRRWVTILIDPKTWIAYRYLNDPDLAHEIGTFDKTAASRHGAQFAPGSYAIRRPGPRQSLDRRPPAPTVKHGSHPHRGLKKGPQGPLRQTWAEPTPKKRVRSIMMTA